MHTKILMNNIIWRVRYASKNVGEEMVDGAEIQGDSLQVHNCWSWVMGVWEFMYTTLFLSASHFSEKIY